jgi:hypothetical protein
MAAGNCSGWSWFTRVIAWARLSTTIPSSFRWPVKLTVKDTPVSLHPLDRYAAGASETRVVGQFESNPAVWRFWYGPSDNGAGQCPTPRPARISDGADDGALARPTTETSEGLRAARYQPAAPCFVSVSRTADLEARHVVLRDRVGVATYKRVRAWAAGVDVHGDPREPVCGAEQARWPGRLSLAALARLSLRAAAVRVRGERVPSQRKERRQYRDDDNPSSKHFGAPLVRCTHRYEPVAGSDCGEPAAIAAHTPRRRGRELRQAVIAAVLQRVPAS